MYQVKNNYLQHLEACIRDPVATVTHNMLENTWTEVEYQLDNCCATRHAHPEMY
jgi:hypothetical protein